MCVVGVAGVAAGIVLSKLCCKIAFVFVFVYLYLKKWKKDKKK